LRGRSASVHANSCSHTCAGRQKATEAGWHGGGLSTHEGKTC
jgi:hypothetical protein